VGTARILLGIAVTTLVAVGLPFWATARADEDCDDRVAATTAGGLLVVDIERSWSPWPPGVRCTVVLVDGTSGETVWPWDR
jgi:hypothetical protein